MKQTAVFMSRWMIHCTYSFKTFINLETKEVTVLMNKTLNHSLSWLVQKTDAFWDDCVQNHMLSE